MAVVLVAVTVTSLPLICSHTTFYPHLFSFFFSLTMDRPGGRGFCGRSEFVFFFPRVLSLSDVRFHRMYRARDDYGLDQVVTTFITPPSTPLTSTPLPPRFTTHRVHDDDLMLLIILPSYHLTIPQSDTTTSILYRAHDDYGLDGSVLRILLKSFTWPSTPYSCATSLIGYFTPPSQCIFNILILFYP